MFNHSFIFSPGTWYGEGKIVLNMVEEELIFNTNWAVQNKDFSGKVSCGQEIQIQGLSAAKLLTLSLDRHEPMAFQKT